MVPYLRSRKYNNIRKFGDSFNRDGSGFGIRKTLYEKRCMKNAMTEKNLTFFDISGENRDCNFR